MRTDAKAIQARLAAAQHRWTREDRERGYSAYRHGKLYKPTAKRVKEPNSFTEGVMLAGGLMAILMLLAI